MSAYEELKAWCEKYLPEEDYKIVPESTSFAQSIYFIENSVGFVCFNGDGSYCGCGGCDEDGMEDHLFDLATDEKAEREEEKASEIVADPPMTSIGGMMIRKMIAEYERKQH